MRFHTHTQEIRLDAVRGQKGDTHTTPTLMMATLRFNYPVLAQSRKRSQTNTNAWTWEETRRSPGPRETRGLSVDANSDRND